ncbi:hypothetical protein KC324_g49 [Hortaea werneckii]|nr:hypothetical protein KC324_g49 [Hortaea werneckii]
MSFLLPEVSVSLSSVAVALVFESFLERGKAPAATLLKRVRRCRGISATYLPPFLFRFVAANIAADLDGSTQSGHLVRMCGVAPLWPRLVQCWCAQGKRVDSQWSEAKDYKSFFGSRRSFCIVIESLVVDLVKAAKYVMRSHSIVTEGLKQHESSEWRWTEGLKKFGNVSSLSRSLPTCHCLLGKQFVRSLHDPAVTYTRFIAPWMRDMQWQCTLATARRTLGEIDRWVREGAKKLTLTMPMCCSALLWEAWLRCCVVVHVLHVKFVQTIANLAAGIISKVSAIKAHLPEGSGHIMFRSYGRNMAAGCMDFVTPLKSWCLWDDGGDVSCRADDYIAT